MDNPISKFKHWWQEALVESPLQQHSAVCISTIDEHGFPAGRFVDLKSVSDDGFVFCSYLDSAKGQQIAHNPKIAMTIWWDHVGYQVRVIGTAQLITTAQADGFWQSRSRSAQLVTTAFAQSAPLAAERDLVTKLQQASTGLADQAIARPDNWGGYCIKPVAIEFLTFRDSRLHLRELFKDQGEGWTKQLLQP
ncbi:pyridoxamine 5'-phosphate oxidase [Rheinheimera riviphila]|uniref:Pyridoxamine 5'-phosphate oxidase n=1 Tax=Rheinheimera riviphila TaxID=1834037 RepID=A0A437QLP0_9GAMM|nr:pyridoxal 5'-phosphate synthase [Rheinheimera riviphila]RVU35436.1 pyridoxamine 5'-phosphate oxidase [Rheinheimera riviphila]